MTPSIPDLLLDPAIKIWVLLPISLVMVMVGILRTNITVLYLQPKRKILDHRVSREQQHLAKLRNYRRNNHVFINQMDFNEKLEQFRKEYEVDNLVKNYIADPEKFKRLKENPTDFNQVLSDMSSGDMMTQMLKGNLANYVPQTVIMYWVNFFYKNYIVLKLPFNLTNNFKSMLQNSMNLVDLDVSYVSSISWYFVNLMGLKSIYALILNDDEMVNQISQQTTQQQQPAAPQAGGPTPDKLFNSELEGLRITAVKSCFTHIQDRFLEKYQ